MEDVAYRVIAYTQGYNVQAVVNEEPIVLAAEVSASSPDFGHLQPMVKATKRELQAIGVSEIPAVAVADSGYWNEQQMDHVVADEHVQVLIPPDAGKRETPRPGWKADATRRCARHWRATTAAGSTDDEGDGRASVRTDQAQPAHQPAPATRTIGRALRMAADHRHPQSPKAPQTPDSRRSGLKEAAAATHATPPATATRPQVGPTRSLPRPRTFTRHPPSFASVSAALVRTLGLPGKAVARRDGGPCP